MRLDTVSLAWQYEGMNNIKDADQIGFSKYPNEALIKELWDIIDDDVPLLWEDEALREDHEVLMAIARVILARHPNWRGEGITASRVARRIKPWIERPEDVSPYLDEVAIARAVDLDTSILESLTGPEKMEVGRRLAKMEQPWGDRLGDFSEWPGPDPRRVAWKVMSRTDRARFREMVRLANEEDAARRGHASTR